MNRSMNNASQENIPGGPSPDYQSIETQRQATSVSGAAAAVPNSRSLGRTPGNTDRPSQGGVDVVSGQSNGISSPPQPAQYSDIEGKRRPSRGSQLEPSGAATAAAAADPKPIFHAKSASEDSGYLSRGPSDATRLRPENTSASRGDAQRSTSLASRRTNRSFVANGSAFVNGAATMTNDPLDVDPSLQARAATADDELKPRDKAVITKEEKNIGRRLSKIIRSEAKAEKASLDVALGELAEIQKLQKASVKEEAESHARHSRALSDAHKADMGLLIARTASEREQAGLRASGEVLEASRKHARETTDMLRDKMQEVERLRAYKGVDDRERAVKVKSLAGQQRKGLSRILRST